MIIEKKKMFKSPIILHSVVGILVVHGLAFYGAYLMITGSTLWKTIFYYFLIGYISMLGIYDGE